MNYCKHLKKRKNKPYCKLLDKEITLSECNKINSDNKCREYKSNNKQISNSAELLQTTANNCKKMKNKSNKLAKMEQNRFSVFTSNMDKCYFCDNPRMDKHEIYRGKNRSNSMKFGFVLPMCRFHHNMYQNDILFNEHWHKTAQRYFEEFIGTRDEFIRVFRRNYLD